MTVAVARRSPLAGIGALGRPTLYLLALISALKAAALVGTATALSMGVVGTMQHRADWSLVVWLGLGSAVLRALATWAHRVVAARALLGAKERLRADLADRLVADGFGSTGSATSLATRGLDELDKYFTVFLPALVNAATIPLLIGARILFADWISAVVIVLTVPLIPVFMVLIGLHTSERMEAATSALARLSDHLVELARGLPVLVGLGRAHEQANALRAISNDYRAKTVQTLKTAFLSSLALELIATISVAVVAVFVGVRLIAGDLTLEVGLIVLLLAPECFTPFRDIGAAYHSSEEGREALGRAKAVLDAPRSMPLAFAHAKGISEASAATADGEPAVAVRVDNLLVQYADRTAPAFAPLSFSAAPFGITVLDGRSGAGKSTVLAILAGRPTGSTTVSGRIGGVEAGRVAWLPQHPRVMDGTVGEELALYAGAGRPAERAAASALRRVGLAHLAAVDTAVISPGELRRLGFARVLVRVEAGARLVLLDEPTSQLDRANAGRIIELIAELRGRATVIVASHDDEVRALADRIVNLDGIAGARPGAVRETSATVTERRRETVAALPGHTGTVAALWGFFRPVRGKILAAVILGLLATLFAASLTALSGWLIVRAGEHPHILYLLVAIVGVRFFGIGRAVLRYSERLVSHDAVFAAATALRMRLWTAFARNGLRSRALLATGRTLDHLVRDVDQVRDLAIRVVLPSIVGVLTAAAALVAIGIIYAPVLPLFVGLAIVGVLGAPIIALIADHAAARGEQQLRSMLTRRLSTMLTAAADLRVNGVDAGVRAELRRLDARAGAAARRGAWALGLANAVIVLACATAAVLVLPLTADAVASGRLRPEIVAVLAFTPLALIDSLLELVAAVQNYPPLRRALGALETIVGERAAAIGGTQSPPTEIDSLVLEGVSATWSSEPVFTGVSAEVRRGQWLVVTGASGSGKSTLLAVLLGQLPALSGRYRIGGSDASALDSEALARRFGWCPQDGHLFDSTLRANLLIARGRDDAPDDAEMLETLRRVGLGRLLDRLPRGLDTRIGAAGDALSGGERQRVAVARTLLTGAQVILIDEPTAHLDAESADRLMADLRVALRDRITVLVTHQAHGVRPEDPRVDLDALAGRRDSALAVAA
ncbi:MAG: transporter ATP-binding protein [Microbacteriaceae bacterium]|nr:transporter ATP-binding protein [Microbacteriaceae bacterium]